MIKNKYEIGDDILIKGRVTGVEFDNKLLSPTYRIRIGNSLFCDTLTLRERRIYSKLPNQSTDEGDLHIIIKELYNEFQRLKQNPVSAEYTIDSIFKDYEYKYNKCLSCL